MLAKRASQRECSSGARRKTGGSVSCINQLRIWLHCWTKFRLSSRDSMRNKLLTEWVSQHLVIWTSVASTWKRCQWMDWPNLTDYATRCTVLKAHVKSFLAGPTWKTQTKKSRRMMHSPVVLSKRCKTSKTICTCGHTCKKTKKSWQKEKKTFSAKTSSMPSNPICLTDAGAFRRTQWTPLW